MRYLHHAVRARSISWLLVVLILAISAAGACGGGEEQTPPAATHDLPTIIEPPKKAALTVTVRKVVDVRTVELSDGEQVKVKGLAAPDECWAAAATSFAKTMLLDKPVDTTASGSLHLADGTDYAVLAVELGMVRNESTDDRMLQEAETTASAKQLGRWGPPCVSPPTGEAPAPTTTTRTTPPAPEPVTGCSVAYRVTHTWPGGFRTDVTIANTGNTEITGWTLRWKFSDGQSVSEMWNATAKQSGPDVFATAVHYNQTIPPGGTLLMGFTAGSGGVNHDPRAFSLNEHPCTLA
ncbi:cellulose binding domain-containing protein [Lentzea kentuckyensis]|uniref:cellulose binding domain-containing protein n=1 Tax=Lentzea kentuckyensis TaxID=360086 RepID=UPI0013027425|nr:cellulose binding domain-containing protein [Lentzea kentuckyensis]